MGTAEIYILSNTFEQTKRDYNREIAARSALENKQGGRLSSGGSTGTGNGNSSMMSSLMQLLVVGLACFLSGARIGASGTAPHLPVVGHFFVDDDASASTTTRIISNTQEDDEHVDL